MSRATLEHDGSSAGFPSACSVGIMTRGAWTPTPSRLPARAPPFCLFSKQDLALEPRLALEPHNPPASTS